MNKIIFIFFILILSIFGLGIFIVTLSLKSQENIPLSTVFFSQEECESTTNKPCSFVMCDYTPPGETIEEVCGSGFKKGWVVQSD